MRGFAAPTPFALHLPLSCLMHRQFDDGKEAGVFDRGGAMAETGEVGLVACESHERRHAALTDYHHEIPMLVSGPDQKWSASGEK